LFIPLAIFNSTFNWHRFRSTPSKRLYFTAFRPLPASEARILRFATGLPAGQADPEAIELGESAFA